MYQIDKIDNFKYILHREFLCLFYVYFIYYTVNKKQIVLYNVGHSTPMQSTPPKKFTGILKYLDTLHGDFILILVELG